MSKKILTILRQQLIAFIVCGLPTFALAQVNVTTTTNANLLVERLVGDGVTYMNPVLTCHSLGAATFTTVASNLGLPGGIILSTGAAETNGSTVGTNGPQSLFAAYSANGPGDPELGSLAQVNTYDACILEFDFVPDGDSVVFDYVFGSEEYDSYSCTAFNDVFAFFISGPNIVTPNLALIPGTNIPVTVNSTTNPAVTLPSSLTACQNMGPGSPFTQYYVDNTNGTTITYYGFTTVLTARTAVSTCDTYHMKLAIADGSDGTLDSGVWLKENSFRSAPVTLELNSKLGTSYNYLVEDCAPGTVVATRSKALPNQQVIKLGYGGTATRNVDYFNVPDSLIIPANGTVDSFHILGIQDNIPESAESIIVYVLNPCSLVPIDSLAFYLHDYLPSTLLTDDTAICAGAEVPMEITYEPYWVYTWTTDPPTGTVKDQGQHMAYGYPDTSTTYTVVATFEGCESEAHSFNVTVEPIPIVEVGPTDTTVCLREPMLIWADVKPHWFQNYTYAWSPKEALNDSTILEPHFFYNTDARDFTYTLTATTPLGCEGSDRVIIRAKPPLDMYGISRDTIIKYGESLQLYASGADFYTWLPDDYLHFPNTANPIITPHEPRHLTIYGLNVHGCRDTAHVFIDVDYTMHDMIPSAFSPNGDGKNDVFRIYGAKFQRLNEFRIFNRWGNEIFNTTNITEGWDGTWKGVPQDVGVYQYLIRVTIPDGSIRTYKGDVTLIR